MPALPDYTIATGEGGASKTLQVYCKDSNGKAVDLTGASAQVFSLNKWTDGSAVAITGTTTIVTATLGLVKYAWVAGDNIPAGNYYGQFKITMADGSILKFPNPNDRLWIAVAQGNV